MSEQTTEGSERLFIAMFPEPQGLPDRLRIPGKENAVIPEENQHVTVLFIGKFPNVRLEDAMNTLRSIAQKKSRFVLEFDSFAAVKGRKPGKGYLWAQYHPSPELQRIHDALADAIGVRGPRSKVLPHVTLSRLDKGTFQETRKAISQVEERGPNLSFDHLTMARSTPILGGSAYAKLGVEPLLDAAP